jgi:hypothetical protein
LVLFSSAAIETAADAYSAELMSADLWSLNNFFIFYEENITSLRKSNVLQHYVPRNVTARSSTPLREIEASPKWRWASSERETLVSEGDTATSWWWSWTGCFDNMIDMEQESTGLLAQEHG